MNNKNQTTKKISVFLAAAAFLFLVIPVTSAPRYKGALDTTAYTARSDGDAGRLSYTQVHEWVLLDLNITEDLNFFLNNRFTWINENTDTQKEWNLNAYYTYFEYMLLDKSLTFQLGRMMQVSNMQYLFYDGLSAGYTLNVAGNKFGAKLYGGMIVNNDYIEEQNKLYTLSSFDYRNLLIEERTGDYAAGIKTSYFLKNIANISIDYQAMMNDTEMAENYVSVDFDTLFSTTVKLFGYGTLNLVDDDDMLSNALLAARFNVLESLLVLASYEYYRPVFLKDSYFWSYFMPYGNHEISASLVYLITNRMTVDAKYGRTIYDADTEQGNHVSAGFEHKDLFAFGLKFNGAYYNGAEGDRVNLQLTVTRQVSIVKLLLGGGTVFYKDDFVDDEFKKARFVFIGADSKVLQSLILSVTGEYYKAEYRDYDVRGIFSVKYLF